MRVRLKPINEQVVVVVGASSGIGRLTAQRFAERGARVVASARGETGLHSLVEEIRSSSGEVMAMVADVTQFEQMEALAMAAVEKYGRIDTWVHLAAVSMWAYFEDIAPVEFKQIVEVDLLGQVYGARAALPYLKRQGGALIHISSVEGKRALPLQSAYAAAKHGVVGFLDALRLELLERDLPISVTNIMPASINTPLFQKSRTKIGVEPKGLAPLYSPEAVADAILYAAEHPTREIVVGSAGRMILTLQALAPRVADTLLGWIGFKDQKSDKPKSPNAPNNLFEPIGGYNRVSGEPETPTRSLSVSTWLRTHPRLIWALTSLALGALFIWRREALRRSA